MTDIGDHVVGTILFTDLVGFTEYTDELGDHAAIAVLDLQRGLVDQVLIDHPGSRLVKEIGDGLMIWFGEDIDGLAAGHEALVAFERARNEEGFPLAVRMGLHRGQAIKRGDDLVGQTVNVAARVSELAGPGELLASAAAVDAAPHTSQVIEAIGPAQIKGVSAPIWLHRVP
jgi:adenylate cyclase